MQSYSSKNEAMKELKAVLDNGNEMQGLPAGHQHYNVTAIFKEQFHKEEHGPWVFNSSTPDELITSLTTSMDKNLRASSIHSAKEARRTADLLNALNARVASAKANGETITSEQCIAEAILTVNGERFDHGTAALKNLGDCATRGYYAGFHLSISYLKDGEENSHEERMNMKLFIKMLSAITL